MLDIIIPVYHAKKTLLRLLMSISLQRNVKSFSVYLIVDNDNENYVDEIKFINNYPLHVLTLDKNIGPGLARQYGIDHSANPYIMFIDSDDYLYSPYALNKIYEKITNNNLDVLSSNFRYERDNEIIIKKNDFAWLHGKIYRRKFLLDNEIQFNETRANEDNGFNRLVLLNNPKIVTLDYITYVYSENPFSITRKENRKYKFTSLESLNYNINWAIKKMIQKNKNLDLCAQSAFATLIAMYYYYLDFYDEYEVDKIICWTSDTLSIYRKLEKKLKNEIKIELIKQKENEYKNINKIISFDDFLKKVSERCD